MLTKKRCSRTFTVIIFLLLNGCVSPSVHYDSLVKKFELVKTTQMGAKYQHLLISNQVLSDRLHVYIEGDGIPWSSRYKISSDPTPKNPLALKLLAQDSNFALYIGRPCYFNLHLSPGCTPSLWTNGRYGKDVIDSMEVTLREFLKSRGVSQIVLIGYSGGGVIASLLANRFTETQLLITIAANLDVAQWANHHGYSPLSQSLNPAEVVQTINKPNIHLVGEQDVVVPAHLNKGFIDKVGGKRVVYSNFDHQCCWEKSWPDILKKITVEHTAF